MSLEQVPLSRLRAAKVDRLFDYARASYRKNLKGLLTVCKSGGNFLARRADTRINPIL